MYFSYPTKWFDVADETPIWRYLDLPRFALMLITSELWFAAPDQLDDAHEGYLSDVHARSWTEWWRNTRIEEIRNRKQTKGLAYAQQELQALQAIDAAALTRTYRKTTVVNCWQSSAESMLMWDAYTARGEGIAIATTLSALKRALSQDYRNSDVSIFYGRVQYPDPESPFPSDLREINPVSIGFIKRPAFRAEEEIRLAIIGNGQPVGIPVKLDVLVQQILLSPRTDLTGLFAKTVRALVDAHSPELAERLRKSDLLDPPSE